MGKRVCSVLCPTLMCPPPLHSCALFLCTYVPSSSTRMCPPPLHACALLLYTHVPSFPPAIEIRRVREHPLASAPVAPPQERQNAPKPSTLNL
jgi:hypothetical protein